jgi:hypothetical protein
VQAALRDILGVNWRIRCGEAGAEGSPAAAAGDSRPAGRGSAPASGPRSATEQTASPRRTAAAANASGAAGRRDGHSGRDHGADGNQPADEEPDRGSSREADRRADGAEYEYDPYSEIDPDADPEAAASYQVHDPSKVAIDLLTAKLGARPIDEP